METAVSGGIHPGLLNQRISAIIDYLHARQGEDGEFPTLRYFCREVGDYVTPTEFPEWHHFGKCPFAVANIVHHITHIDHPKVREIVRKGCDYLARGMEANGVARYVAGYAQPVYFPADIDDTVLALMVLRQHGSPFVDNRQMLTRNVDRNGRFYTWFMPRWRHAPGPGNLAWLIRDYRTFEPRLREKSLAYRDHMIKEFRESMEPGILANVALYLGENRVTRRAIASVVADVERGTVYLGYYNELLFAYFHIARAVAGGITAFGRLKDRIVAEVVARQDQDGCVRDGFATAVAALTLMDLECWDHEALARAIGRLADDPMFESGWVPQHYCNDLDGIFLDGGAELTAAFFLAALERWRERQPG